MAIITMIYGQSGTGKSTSLRNIDPKKILVINVSKKPLPFQNNFETIDTTDYLTIVKAIQETNKKIIIIDDATYLMTDEFMRRAKETGFQKFTDLAVNFYTLVTRAAELPKDKTVYFFGHSDIDASGNEKFKTIGKLLDEKITLEGMFTTVLKTVVKDNQYSFSTRNSGTDTVKSPLGMFESELIPNDLAEVDKTIRSFYGIGG